MKKYCIVIPLSIFLSLLILTMFIFSKIYQVYQDPIKTKNEIIKGINDLESHILSVMTNYNIHRVSVAIIANSELIYKKGFNMKSSDTMQAASISKMITAYSVLKLVESGKLELDTLLQKYEAKPYIPKQRFKNTITFRHVLNHTSGLANDISGTDRQIYFKPGSRFSYSGGGFSYLQNIIENLSGAPFDRYIESQVLKPLNMNSSSFSYIAEGNTRPWAGASLVSTAPDLAKFLIELMNPQHIKAELMSKMINSTVKVNEQVSWGLGVGIQHSYIEDAIWHWGNNDSRYHTLVIIYKKSKTGIVIMVDGLAGLIISKDIAHKAIGGPHFYYWYGIPYI